MTKNLQGQDRNGKPQQCAACAKADGLVKTAFPKSCRCAFRAEEGIGHSDSNQAEGGNAEQANYYSFNGPEPGEPNTFCIEALNPLVSVDRSGHDLTLGRCEKNLVRIGNGVFGASA